MVELVHLRLGNGENQIVSKSTHIKGTVVKSLQWNPDIIKYQGTGKRIHYNGRLLHGVLFRTFWVLFVISGPTVACWTSNRRVTISRLKCPRAFELLKISWFKSPPPPPCGKKKDCKLKQNYYKKHI